MKKIDMSKIITPEEVYQAARETGFLKRVGGKINPFDMLMTLVFRMSQVLPPALRGHPAHFLLNINNLLIYNTLSQLW